MSEDVNARLASIQHDMAVGFEQVDKKILKLNQDFQAKTGGLEGDIAAVKGDLKNKVSWKLFISILLSLLGFILTVNLAICGILLSQMQKLNDISTQTRETVARLEGKLQPFDFITEE